ncbi:hypothetical protein ACFQL1_14260 [Halomicroarcula sp. GCM10025709]|uniref:hypothetical protein n=1 Tax=Haloarcula TaxID=2237 RepID=UPI0024C3BE1D|nr:hypothetical protein [Halomicroarcula sp. YJ-61-S]
MLDELDDLRTPTCEHEACDRSLGEPALVFRTESGCRAAYECPCGAVTVTVIGPESAR